MIFGAGVFIALEKSSSRGVVLALIEQHLADGTPPATTNAALAQARRQVRGVVSLNPLVAVALNELVMVFPYDAWLTEHPRLWPAVADVEGTWIPTFDAS